MAIPNINSTGVNFRTLIAQIEADPSVQPTGLQDQKLTLEELRNFKLTKGTTPAAGGGYDALTDTQKTLVDDMFKHFFHIQQYSDPNHKVGKQSLITADMVTKFETNRDDALESLGLAGDVTGTGGSSGTSADHQIYTGQYENYQVNTAQTKDTWTAASEVSADKLGAVKNQDGTTITNLKFPEDTVFFRYRAKSEEGHDNWVIYATTPDGNTFVNNNNGTTGHWKVDPKQAYVAGGTAPTQDRTGVGDLPADPGDITLERAKTDLADAPAVLARAADLANLPEGSKKFTLPDAKRALATAQSNWGALDKTATPDQIAKAKSDVVQMRTLVAGFGAFDIAGGDAEGDLYASDIQAYIANGGTNAGAVSAADVTAQGLTNGKVTDGQVAFLEKLSKIVDPAANADGRVSQSEITKIRGNLNKITGSGDAEDPANKALATWLDSLYTPGTDPATDPKYKAVARGLSDETPFIMSDKALHENFVAEMKKANVTTDNLKSVITGDMTQDQINKAAAQDANNNALQFLKKFYNDIDQYGGKKDNAINTGDIDTMTNVA